MEKKLKVTQVRSGIGRPKNQRQTLKGLGFRRVGHTVVVNDTPAIRGMIRTVNHLISWTEV